MVMPALFSCSKKASAETRLFAKAVAQRLPDSLFLSRSDKSVDWLVDFARYQGLEFLVLVSPLKAGRLEWRGIRVQEGGWSEAFTATLALAKQAAKKKAGAKELCLAARDRKALRLFGPLLDADTLSAEAGLRLREGKKDLSFFEGEAEVGPAFSVEGVSFAK